MEGQRKSSSRKSEKSKEERPLKEGKSDQPSFNNHCVKEKEL